MDTLPIALGQLTSIDSVEKNLAQIKARIQEASAAGAKILFFPENSLYMRIVEGQKIPGVELSDPAFKELHAESQKHKITLHMGSLPLRQGDKVFNSSVTISPDQPPRVTYQKLHLFDITFDGQKPIRESDLFGRGESPAIIEIEGWKLGQSICYDLRFAELYHHYAVQEVDAILVPSAFLVPTGKVHWDILLRARAIESQCYVIAAAQVGLHHGITGATRETYGNSLVVDPWGDVVAKGSPDQPQLIVAEIKKERIKQVRRQIPMKGHRRL